MTIPNEAEFEARVAGGVVLYDVVKALPRHKVKRYRDRDEPIERVFTHHSGALGRAGFEGMAASARYVVSPKRPWKKNGDWPGFAYTYWLAYKADTDRQGNLVIYRGNHDETRSNHTGGTNDNSIAVVWQGNTTKKPPSSDQIEMAEAFYPWLVERHKATLVQPALSFHAEAGKYGGRSKRTCPGSHLEMWLRGYRAST